MKAIARRNCLKVQPFYVKILNYLRNPSGKLTYEKMKVIARWNCLKVQPFYVKILNYLRNPSGKLTYEKTKAIARRNCLKAQPLVQPFNKAANLTKGYYRKKEILLSVNPSGKLTYEKMKAIARRNCPKAQPFFDKVFRARGIKYCVTSYEKEELLRALNLSERTDA